MPHKKILCIGHSHVGALRRALPDWQKENPESEVSFEVVNLSRAGTKMDSETRSTDQAQRPSNARKYYMSPDGAGHFGFGADIQPISLDAHMAQEVRSLLLERRPDELIVLGRGNEHVVLSLLQHPIRFDFAIPGETSPLCPESEELPYRLIKAQIKKLAECRALLFWDFCNVACRDIFDGPIYMLPPPPPIPSEGHILAHPGKIGQKAATFGISPSRLRAKIWRVYTQILKEAAEASGQTFIKLPSTIFENGCLAPQFWGQDPTHGNDNYGKVILDHVLFETHQKAVA